MRSSIDEEPGERTDSRRLAGGTPRRKDLTMASEFAPCRLRLKEQGGLRRGFTNSGR